MQADEQVLVTVLCGTCPWLAEVAGGISQCYELLLPLGVMTAQQACHGRGTLSVGARGSGMVAVHGLACIARLCSECLVCLNLVLCYQ
jgi:hypothetical protein